MPKFRIQTVKTSTKEYYLTYEVEAKDENEAREIYDEEIPTDEEFFDESSEESITEVEEI